MNMRVYTPLPFECLRHIPSKQQRSYYPPKEPANGALEAVNNRAAFPND